MSKRRTQDSDEHDNDDGGGDGDTDDNCHYCEGDVDFDINNFNILKMIFQKLNDLK